MNYNEFGLTHKNDEWMEWTSAWLSLYTVKGGKVNAFWFAIVHGN